MPVDPALGHLSGTHGQSRRPLRFVMASSEGRYCTDDDAAPGFWILAPGYGLLAPGLIAANAKRRPSIPGSDPGAGFITLGGS